MAKLRALIRETPESLWLSGSLCFLLLLFAPLESYCTNLSDVTYDIYDLLKLMLPLSILCFFLMSVFLMAVKKWVGMDAYRVLLRIGFIALLSLFVEGAFFSSYLPQLDGSRIVWEELSMHRITSVGIWLLISALFIFASHKIETEKTKRMVAWGSGLLLCYLAVMAAVLCLTGGALRDKKNLIITDRDMLVQSDRENLVILLLDMVGNPEFSAFLEEHPEYVPVFDDFTCFDNAFGAYPFTACAIPYIFSGEWFEYQCDFEDYRIRAFEESELLSTLQKNNWSLGLYDIDLGLSDDAGERYVNVMEPAGNRFASPVKFILMQVKLVGYKYFPFDLKRFCVLTPEDISFDSEKAVIDEMVYQERSDFLYRQLTEKGIQVIPSDQNAFRYIHVQGAHYPYHLDRNFEYVEDASLEDVMETCLKLISELVNGMKAANTYDGSAIVIMSDHGGDDSRSNPILYVKGIGESHPLCLNTAPVAWGDLQEAFRNLSEGLPADAIFSVKEGEQRKRRFLSYGVLGNDPFTEYIQTGYANEFDTLMPTGRVITKE